MSLSGAIDKTPEGRDYLVPYLTGDREGLIQKYGPTEADLTAPQAILIERAVNVLTVLRVMEVHIVDTGFFIGNRHAAPLRESYITYTNALRLVLRDLETISGASGRDDSFDVDGYIRKQHDKNWKGGKNGSKARAMWDALSRLLGAHIASFKSQYGL
jgi:hypothetical protein